MIHPALYQLIGMQGRGAVRRMLRGAKSPGRLVVLILGAALCVVWVISALASMTHRNNPQRVRDVMPVALLTICVVITVTSAGDKAIAFTPGEVDQLFPGPFTRRELLIYKLIKSTLAAILTSLFLSVIMLKNARWWPACFGGVFFSLLFIQFFSTIMLLAGQAVGAAAYSRVRKLILIGAGILIVIGARTWIHVGAGGAEAAVVEFRNSPVGNVVLAPFEPFGELMTAFRGVDAIKWALLAAVFDGALVMIVLMLDSYYVETAMAASERRYAKIQRVRAGSFLSVGVGKTSQWHLPQLPWAGGAGPIAWRQLANAARSSRGLLLLLVIVAVGAAPVLAFAGHGEKVLQLLVQVMLWLTFLCASMLNFDFRGDIDHIESLKALPLREWAVVVGELLVPVLLLTSFHVLLLTVAAIVAHAPRGMLLVVFVLALPFNTLLFSFENLIFLLFPSRPTAVSPGDFQVMGRKFVFMLAKILMLVLTSGVALFIAVMVYVLARRNLAIATVVGAGILTAEIVALIPVLAWAFRRYDPSIHTPA